MDGTQQVWGIMVSNFARILGVSWKESMQNYKSTRHWLWAMESKNVVGLVFFGPPCNLSQSHALAGKCFHQKTRRVPTSQLFCSCTFCKSEPLFSLFFSRQRFFGRTSTNQIEITRQASSNGSLTDVTSRLNKHVLADLRRACMWISRRWHFYEAIHASWSLLLSSTVLSPFPSKTILHGTQRKIQLSSDTTFLSSIRDRNK